MSSPRSTQVKSGLSPDLIGASLPRDEWTWTERDCRIYALGIGAGSHDPLDELEYTTENSHGRAQKVYPTLGVLAGTRVGIRGLVDMLGDAVDVRQMLHGGQHLTQHRPLPLQASVVTTGKISAMWDKGNATVIETVTDTADVETGELYCTSTQSLFFRGVGGWGGERGPAPMETPSNVARDADERLVVPTRPDQTLLYRLSGDENPLHSDPVAAKAAGFDRPIMHGLCVYGVVGRVLLNTCSGADHRLFRELSARFRRPAMPGDDLVISVWRDVQPGRFDFEVSRPDGERLLSRGRYVISSSVISSSVSTIS